MPLFDSFSIARSVVETAARLSLPMIIAVRGADP